MPNVHFFRPVDPPSGVDRMIDQLHQCLQSPDYEKFYFAVAFAKVGPLLRLTSEFEGWQANGKEVHGIFGIDLKGTSAQALEFAASLFTSVHVTHNPVHTTFHPKIYLFEGEQVARVYMGSQNMTVGGLELNYEAGVCVDIDLGSEKDVWDNAFGCWDCLLPANCPNTAELTPALFQSLLDEGYLFDERMTRTSTGGDKGKSRSSQKSGLFPSVYPSPPSSIRLPKKYKKKPAPAAAKPKAAAARKLSPRVTTAYHTLAIQIIPHHNGEIFLSKTALDQSPDFFGYPFTGQTTPKFATNRSYPMREPDPSVTLTIYGDQGAIIHDEVIENLNMVFYTRKSDIRITINPTLAKSIPEYSILVMKLTEESSPYDYELEIYYPGSQMYNAYDARCDQKMPSGGKPIPRRMGWL